MSIVVVLILLLLAGAAIVYPLLPGRAPSRETPTVSDSEIEKAVRGLRRARSREGHHCPACGKGYHVGDRYCVRCGGALPQAVAQSPGSARDQADNLTGAELGARTVSSGGSSSAGGTGVEVCGGSGSGPRVSTHPVVGACGGEGVDGLAGSSRLHPAAPAMQSARAARANRPSDICRVVYPAPLISRHVSDSCPASKER